MGLDKGVAVSNGHIVIGETIGTATLILLGCGVVAAVVLKKSKAQDAGWLAITFAAMEYWEPKFVTGVFAALIIVGAATKWLYP